MDKMCRNRLKVRVYKGIKDILNCNFVEHPHFDRLLMDLTEEVLDNIAESAQDGVYVVKFSNEYEELFKSLERF